MNMFPIDVWHLIAKHLDVDGIDALGKTSYALRNAMKGFIVSSPTLLMDSLRLDNVDMFKVVVHNTVIEESMAYEIMLMALDRKAYRIICRCIAKMIPYLVINNLFHRGLFDIAQHIARTSRDFSHCHHMVLALYDQSNILYRNRMLQLIYDEASFSNNKYYLEYVHPRDLLEVCMAVRHNIPPRHEITFEDPKRTQIVREMLLSLEFWDNKEKEKA